MKNKLKQSEEAINMLLEAIDDTFSIHKLNGEYLYYNGPKHSEITPQVVVGKMLHDLFEKDVCYSILNAFNTVKKTGESETIEVFFDWLGEKKWFSEHIYPIKNSDGDVVEILKICRDIHKRKIAEQEVESQNTALIENKKELDHQNEKLYQLNNALNQAQKLSHVGNWQWNMVTDKAEWSDEMYRIYGVTKDNFYPSNENVTKTVLPEDLHKVEKGIGSLLIDEMFIPFEFRIKRPSGEIRTLYIMALEKNSQESIFGVTKDITEQKQIEKEKLSDKLRLEKISSELNEAQALANIGSWLYNPFSQKSEWSDEMFNIWSFDSKNGTPLLDLIIKRLHPEDLELFHKSLSNATSIGTAFDIEYRIVIPHEKEKIVRVICRAELNDKGEVLSLKGTTQDITVQKQFEEAQIKHQRLKAMGEMSSSIAHDFNNSLQQIMGNLEMLKLQNNFSDNNLERLNNIGVTIADVAGRISALQKFGDTEHNDENSTLIDFNTLIEESLKESRPLWKDGMEKEGFNISVITEMKEIPKISCNRGELKSVIYNLIKNSVEAMPKGGDLTIKTGLKTEGVFISFSDTGIGMDKESQGKIFQPFYSTKGFNLGRGLGMSGAYSIVKKHRGNIVVKSSEIMKGTTIEMVFPIAHQDETKIKNKKEQKDKKTFNVLWVDDDLLITKSVSIMVGSIGHKCNAVNSGKKALEYLNNNPCDIVFTDIGMPKMNGWELASAIKNQFGNKIKIVIVSGWNITNELKMEQGVHSILQKPFFYQDLEDIFRSI